MEISIFDAVGPIMIGPSSSHTAGAAKLGRVAALIVGKPFKKVEFGLHGSFAKTYKGHGTDIALAAGVLGLNEADERLKEAFTLAKQQGIELRFYETELDGMHENSVRMTFYLDDRRTREIIGSSIGGGQIMIRSIDGFRAKIPLNSSTLVITHEDKHGVLFHVTKILAEAGINIATVTLTRQNRGALACAVIETDSFISDSIVKQLEEEAFLLSVQAINI